MRRHVIYGRYGVKDTVKILSDNNEVATEIDLLTARNELGLGIGNALRDLEKLNVFPTDTAVDLLILAAHVQAADARISRSAESQDSWTREIRLVVPVANVKLWQSTGGTIKRALDFLTGDLWTVQFRSRPKQISALATPGKLKLEKIPFDSVSLFSGGLDSLIGAINLLEDNKTPLLVGHAGEGVTSRAQKDCLKGLMEKYPNNSFTQLRLWMDMRGFSVSGSPSETTSRGRSFLFFATGVLAASGLATPFVLNVPENGLIALNVPLDPLRLGSHSTRTTHPFYIARWNEILSSLRIPGEIENPYWNKTKGEMVEDCSNKRLLKALVPKSMSCSHPSQGRYKKLSPNEHCGYCLPCLIRRAAIETGLDPSKDNTTYRISNLTKRTLNSEAAEGQQIRSVQFAASRLKSRPGSESSLIHAPGPLSDKTAHQRRELAGVYKRGLLEVEDLVKNVRTKAGGTT